MDGADVEAARQQLQRLMRDAEADIAEALSNEGWLTVLDGPLHGIRHRRGLAIIGYVKTHHRRMLAGQGTGADGRGTVGPLRDWRTRSTAATCGWATLGRGRVRGLVRGLASPASRCRQASAAPPRSQRPTRPRGGCRASRRRCTGTRGPL